MRAKKHRKTALIKRISKPQNIVKILKLQALFRGHLVRLKHAHDIAKIKNNAPKKTKKYKLISKL